MKAAVFRQVGEPLTIEEAAALVKPGSSTGPWSHEDLLVHLHRYREESGEATDTAGVESFINWLEKQ